MLLERGPVDPVDVDAWTRPGARTTFEADAAAVAGQLAGAGATLGARLGTMASAPTSRVEASAGGALNQAIVAHAGQAPDPDPTIGAIAGNADGQEGAITGFGNEAADAIAQAEPPNAPGYTSHPPDPDWGIGEGGGGGEETPTPPPGGTVADLIIRFYNKYLRRDPLLSEINLWSARWPNQDAIEHGILFSGEYGDKVNALYQQYFERDVTGGELGEYRARKDGLDDVEEDLRRRS